MALRKAIGAVKDQTSIGIVKVTSQIPILKVAIVKATSHDDDPANEKYIREILNFTCYTSRLHINACVATLSKRLSKTRDWIVGIKVLILINRLLNEGDPEFLNEFRYATRRGTRLLNLSDFRDEAHSNSWDHTSFIRTYANYLDQKVQFLVYEKKQSGGGGGEGNRRRSPPPGSVYNDDYGNYGVRIPQRSHSYGDVGEFKRREEEKKPSTPLREMKVEMILGKMNQLQRLLDRFLANRPMGIAKNCRLVLIALYPIVQESFKIYGEICEVLSVLLDKFFDMEYVDCVKVFEAYASVAKQIDELIGFYNWCKDSGIARSSDFPQVQRITDKLLETLEEFLKDREKKPKSPEKAEKAEIQVVEEEEPVQNLNEIKALPAPEIYSPHPPVQEEVIVAQKETGDLVDLREEVMSTEDQSNKLALALFSAPQTSSLGALNGVTSAWQNPAAETGKADWELALVESVSHLSSQKASLPGGFDPLLLNGMYDQGAVSQHASAAQFNSGSASSVALPGLGKSTTPVLALPAPDGSIQTVSQDPFAASISIPPPSYVQMADMEKKQQLLVQEQEVWNQYARGGMQGQVSLAKISGSGFYNNPNPMGMMIPPYGMQPNNGVGPVGYYYAPQY
ncbi:Clathrin coat assembly protein [Thalictrum thalictroides]|uniref:Clathrin coat assembly protein n=1 Tax=Thalictrum thalictroides TaxID=46969 RepID=A0A7J6VEL1_THATH|nr:Clathrin coat assembly protein [Thalictrum thalictroides]